MMTKYGAMRDMLVTVCDVSQTLGSVSRMCKVGHRVVSNPPCDPAGPYTAARDWGANVVGRTEWLICDEHNGGAIREAEPWES